MLAIDSQTASSNIISIVDAATDQPTRTEPGGEPTWIASAENFVILITKVNAGTVLASGDTPDEHIVILPDAAVSLTTGGEAPVEIDGYHLVIVPPGASEIVARSEGLVIRCFSSRRADLLALGGNRPARSAQAGTALLPLGDSQPPPGGFKVRAYSLADHRSSDGRKRVFRSSNLMVNVLMERDQPRDVRALTPHSHKNFEQGSIAVFGSYIHHLRTPWTPDMTRWLPDEALTVGSPSVVVIPPEVVHTSRNVGWGRAMLIDVFAPPRADFSAQPGTVCNADDYPLDPEEARQP